MTATNDEPDLTTIIVSWNVRSFLWSCLKSLEEARKDIAMETIVVDGGSADGSPEMVSEHFAWVKLIALSENVGFPRGNNLGIERARGRYVLLLNPDTEIIGDALHRLVEYLDRHPDVGVVGARLLNPDGTIQSSRRRFPTLLTAIFESTWLEGVAPRVLLRHYYAEDLPNDKDVDVDWLVGACLMVRKSVIDQVGLMDESYFMYSEELDWCYRIKREGWRLVYIPSALIVHHVGKSSEQAVTERHINFQRAKLRFFRKYHGFTKTTILRGILLLNYVWQIGLEGTKGILGHKRSLRRQRVKAYWRVLRSGLRPAGY